MVLAAQSQPPAGQTDAAILIAVLDQVPRASDRHRHDAGVSRLWRLSDFLVFLQESAIDIAQVMEGYWSPFTGGIQQGGRPFLINQQLLG
jgi:hypothetical protein